MKSVSLDKTDRKILQLLQQNARMTVKEIASRLYMSSPAISARIRGLEEAGVIRGYHADIDPAFLGYTIKAFVNLEVDPKQKEEFYSFLRGLDAMKIALSGTDKTIMLDKDSDLAKLLYGIEAE